ncbi:hypothetical protein CXG81DRAFT_27393 [Caulochytrium protostelioides]|uniref:Uncharacterized protein n=1 Tax=Caulochytrium protostelioides TaxID=1555241 RepID=A0A4P9X492_9FUNG|nr:hypothetical protein CXG81DRAFT_27393 [Caulochytrium protostelioides]|eukprot:RKO99885.1 hypothetical protein CXG81DRAFT_27393 [Caulochytrium protostelioides]
MASALPQHLPRRFDQPASRTLPRLPSIASLDAVSSPAGAAAAAAARHRRPTLRQIRPDHLLALIAVRGVAVVARWAAAWCRAIADAAVLAICAAPVVPEPAWTARWLHWPRRLERTPSFDYDACDPDGVFRYGDVGLDAGARAAAAHDAAAAAELDRAFAMTPPPPLDANDDNDDDNDDIDDDDDDDSASVSSSELSLSSSGSDLDLEGGRPLHAPFGSVPADDARPLLPRRGRAPPPPHGASGPGGGRRRAGWDAAWARRSMARRPRSRFWRWIAGLYGRPPGDAPPIDRAAASAAAVAVARAAAAPASAPPRSRPRVLNWPVAADAAGTPASRGRRLALGGPPSPGLSVWITEDRFRLASGRRRRSRSGRRRAGEAAEAGTEAPLVGRRGDVRAAAPPTPASRAAEDRREPLLPLPPSALPLRLSPPPPPPEAHGRHVAFAAAARAPGGVMPTPSVRRPDPRCEAWDLAPAATAISFADGD